MIIDCHLNKEPYDLIKNNIKHYEYRINDEKRRTFKVGDILRFYLRPEEKEWIDAKIIELKYYDNFYDMYEDSFNDYLYKIYDSVDAARDEAFKYYTKEEETKYGCVAIKIEVI